MLKSRRPSRLPRRSEGALCVTFINVAAGRGRAIDTYADLLAWGVETSAIAAAEAARLERQASEHPGQAQGVVRYGHALGARLERLLVAFVEGAKPAPKDLATFNAELSTALASRRLITTADNCEWAWGERENDLDRMLWPVLLSAADLLASGEAANLRRCLGEDCGRLFVARGSGRPRKWCSASCGNRATSRKHYRRVVRPQRERLKAERQGRQASRLAGYGDP